MVLIKTQTYQLFYLCIKSDQKKDMSMHENMKVARRTIEAFNTGDTSKIHEFISADYINRESHCSCIRIHHLSSFTLLIIMFPVLGSIVAIMYV